MTSVEDKMFESPNLHVQGGGIKLANPPPLFSFQINGLVLWSAVCQERQKKKTVLLLLLLLVLVEEITTVEQRQFWRVDMSQWWRRLSQKRLFYGVARSTRCAKTCTQTHKKILASVAKGVTLTALFDLMCQQRALSGVTGRRAHQLGSIIHSVAKRPDDATLTVVLHASVLAGQADVRLLLAHHHHVLWPQAAGVA